MRSTLEPVEPTKVRINVVVEPDELRPAIDRTARRLSREVRVPGFRKGKVPRQVIEARIGREALLAEAIEQEAVPEFYAKAIEELGVQPLSRAQVEPPDYTDGEALEFSATFEVKPELDLPPYQGVEVERPVLEVTDEHVDAQLERLRDRTAQLEVIGRPLAKDDFAQIDLRATHHTDEIPELTRSDFLYEVGSGTVVPELDEELEGKRKGDILRFNATLPEEAGEELAGREVTFQVLVKEAKAKVLPKLDDDFAQEASEFDTLDELKADLRQRLEGAAEAQTGQRAGDPGPAGLPRPGRGAPARVAGPRRAALPGQPLRPAAGPDDGGQPRAVPGGPRADRRGRRGRPARPVRAGRQGPAGAGGGGRRRGPRGQRGGGRRRDPAPGPAGRARPRGGPQAPSADGRVGVITGDILRSKALAFMVEHAEQHDPAPDDESEPKE